MLYYFGKKRIKDDDSTWVVLVNYIVTVDASLHVSCLVSYSEIVLSDPLHGLHLSVHVSSAWSPLSFCFRRFEALNDLQSQYVGGVQLLQQFTLVWWN